MEFWRVLNFNIAQGVISVSNCFSRRGWGRIQEERDILCLGLLFWTHVDLIGCATKLTGPELNEKARKHNL